MKTITALCIGLVLAVASTLSAQVTIDKGIARYEKTSGVSGNLTSVGSDTLNNLMTLWAEEFRGLYPGVRIQIEGKGSGTAPPALISGVSQLGPMSRAMKAKEADGFEKKFGYKPTAIPVAVDGLAVYVHKDNPIERLTMKQVDAIFSKSRLGGAKANIEKWGQAGLTGSWANRAISLFGRNSASGTYGYFKKKALFKGDYKDIVKEQPGSASVVQGVAETLGGVGYSGIGYKTSEVRAVALSKDGKNFFEPIPQYVYTGKYPLSRFLYVYVNKKPNTPLNPMILEFLKFVLARQGQEIVVKDGYLPLKEKMVMKSLKALGAISN